MAMARLIKRLLDAGLGIDTIGMLKTLAERDVRQATRAGDERLLCEIALRILYQRKVFREETGRDEEHYPEGPPAVGGARRMMRVSVDADLCSGRGCCVALCPDVFTHLGPEGDDVGVSHVREGTRILPPAETAVVPPEHEAAVVRAALECPGEIIALFGEEDPRHRLQS
jgi:ferredoxin